MEFYIPLLVFYFVAGAFEFNWKTNNRKNYLYLLLLIFPVFALTAFRSERIGNDTLTYLMTYESISEASSLGIAIIMSRLEAGYVAICYWASQLGLSFFQFQIVTTTFIYAGFYYFIYRYSRNYSFSCLLLIGIGCMAGSMNTVRMYIAIAFLLFSIPCLLSRKWIRFLILLLCAVLIHKSSAVFGIMLPLCLVPYSRKLVSLMFLAAMIILYMGITFFELLTDTLEVYEGYLDSRYFDEFNTTAILISLMTSIIIFLFLWSEGYFNHPQYAYRSKKMLKKKVVTIEYYNRMAMLVTLCLGIIGLGNTIMSRISGYFSVCFLVMLPGVLYDVKSKSRRFIAYILIAFFYIAYFVAIRILRPNWNHITPYEWGF